MVLFSEVFKTNRTKSVFWVAYPHAYFFFMFWDELKHIFGQETYYSCFLLAFSLCLTTNDNNAK